MKTYKEESLSNFKFWSGAIALTEEFMLEELDRIGEELEAINAAVDNGLEDTDINDLMWFGTEYLARLIGLKWDSEKGKILR